MPNPKLKLGKKPAVAIVGFGRFGRTLHRLLRDDFALTVYSRTKPTLDLKEKTAGTKIAESLSEVYQCPTVFFCVPIQSFEAVIKEHKPYFLNHLLIDTLSVKMHPAKIFKKYLRGTKATAILTHPMFGPDSSRNGFAGLPLVLNQFTAGDKEYQYWKKYFTRQHLKIIELSAAEHDHLAANSQGLTHLIGRLLEEMRFTETLIDTVGAKKLHEVQNQIGHNTWELFVGLETYNPYAKKMRRQFDKAYNRLCQKLKREEKGD